LDVLVLGALVLVKLRTDPFVVAAGSISMLLILTGIWLFLRMRRSDE
jgi:hypothetical protein